MKAALNIVLVTLLAVTLVQANEPSDADQRWAKVVEQKIAAGPTTISTPSETRAKLAEAIARKWNRTAKVTKTANGFSIEIRSSETARN